MCFPVDCVVIVPNLSRRPSPWLLAPRAMSGGGESGAGAQPCATSAKALRWLRQRTCTRRLLLGFLSYMLATFVVASTLMELARAMVDLAGTMLKVATAMVVLARTTLKVSRALVVIA